MDRTTPSEELRESFFDELDTVFVRHNALIRERPDMAVALLINMADGLRDKFGVTADVEELEPGKVMVTVRARGDESGAFLGFKRDPDTGEIKEDNLTDEMEYVD